MLNIPTLSRYSQKGFSLVEIMIGMIIGMLGIIIIMQVTSVFEARKRTTSSGDDAQNGGAIAIASMQRDIDQAGYGLSSPQLIGTSLLLTASGARPALTLNPLTPVMLNPAQLGALGDVGTNKILMIYGNSSNVEGSWITNSTATLPYMISLGAGTGGATDGGKGFNVGDWVIPSQSGVTGSVATPHSLYQVNLAAASSVAVTGAPPALVYAANNAAVPLLFNLGSSPSLLAYAVINRSLVTCNYLNTDCSNAASWTQLAGDVYALRAQCESTTGVRIALVTRNAQYDPTVVTTATPTWSPNGATTPVVANPVAAWGANWNHYRYKTFESIVPIRNAIWATGGVQGCS